MSTTALPSSHPPALVLAGFIAALVAVAVVVAAGPGYRLKIVDLGVAFGALRWGAWLGLAAAAVALAGAWSARPGTGRSGFALALAGVVIGGAVFGALYVMQGDARKAPPIHDIATDVDHPLGFVAIVPLRAGASNPLEYGGPDVAQKQRAAFPDIRPLILAVPPDAAFARALETARDMGWEIVAAVPAERRIEATDTTRWFGFRDDIVVQVTPADGGGSRIDVRSLSRIGSSDLGKNAARVRAYLQKLVS